MPDHKRPRSKRDLASDEIEQAISHASKALSKLGGRVRYASKKTPADGVYQARAYLQSVINRLAIAKDLVDFWGRANNVAPTSYALLPLRDDFEREYDRTREPQC